MPDLSDTDWTFPMRSGNDRSLSITTLMPSIKLDEIS